MEIETITIYQWVVAAFCALLVGMSKTGVAGIGMLVVPFLAISFGGMPSTGLLLPMLIMADIFAVSYYHRSAKWRHILNLLPWALTGIAAGLIFGKSITAETFKKFIGISVLASLAIMIWNDYRKKDPAENHSWWYTALFGLAGGFTTMIGNAAGPVMSVYLLSTRLPKNEYIGTGAWFFLTINVIKFPLQLWVWHNINYQTLTFNLWLLPLIAVGAFAGIKLVKLVSDKHYRMFVLAITLLSALVLLI